MAANRRYTAIPRGRVVASGYSEAGASLKRRALRSFIPNSNAPKYDIDANLSTLRQRSRMLCQASPVAASAIRTNRTKVVGSGLTLKCDIGREVLGFTPEQAKAWQRRTEFEWRMWSGRREYCDAQGLNSFTELQSLALQSWLQSGDVFVLLCNQPTKRGQSAFCAQNPYSLRVQIIEADRVRTPTGMLHSKVLPFAGMSTEGINPDNGNRIFAGVEVDKMGRVVAYHISDEYPRPVDIDPDAWTRVEAIGRTTGLPNVLHVMEAERPDQYRGVPYLATAIEPLLQMRRYTESALMSALVQSMHTAWIKTNTNQSEIPFNPIDGGEMGGDISHVEGASEYAMGAGIINHLAPGEEVQFGNPNIPSANFDVFLSVLCRQMGAALEIPHDVLLKQYNSSYSAARAALMEAWEAIKMRRAWFVSDFCQPIYERWLTEAVALGRIHAPGFFDDPLVRTAWCGARWIGPAQGQIDPLKEVKAAQMQIELGIKTHEQVTIEQGGWDWDGNVEQLTRENQALAKAGGGRAELLQIYLDDIGQKEE